MRHLDKLATLLFSIQIPAYIVQRIFTEENSLAPVEFVESLQVLFAGK